jgi:hypothetical protein
VRPEIGAALLGVLVVVLLLAMARGWRRSAARAADVVPALPQVPAPDALGAVRAGPLEATYLATALATDRLARVAAHGLGSRCPARVTVHDAGTLVERTGVPDLFVPTADLLAATPASGVAGTAVGRDRAVVLRWRCGTVTLDTGVLPRHAADVAPLVAALGTSGSGAAADGPAPTTDGSPA